MLISPITVLTDGTGYYRIPYLPPGSYRLSFELPGFATHVREGVGLRAGANFAVDAFMKISGIQETITVTAETPMLEIAKPSNVLNVDGDFQRDMPIQAQRNWSDFLELTPGVHARPFDDGSGRMAYFGHGADLWANVIQLEGMVASSNTDAQAAQVSMGADMIEDVQVKTGGVDAASPNSTGLVINVVTTTRRKRFQRVGRLRLPAYGVEWRQRPDGRQLQWDADDAESQSVGRLFGWTHRSGQGLVLWFLPPGRSGKRHQSRHHNSSLFWNLSRECLWAEAGGVFPSSSLSTMFRRAFSRTSSSRFSSTPTMSSAAFTSGTM